ncbi:MAG: hypothetical protein OEY23_15285 [Acidimicrobiia bacterium]|nr:hypothetical protein [Acidimicrobiia bacterium]
MAGSSIDSLAAQLDINETTIISHLDRRLASRHLIPLQQNPPHPRCSASHAGVL